MTNKYLFTSLYIEAYMHVCVHTYVYRPYIYIFSLMTSTFETFWPEIGFPNIHVCFV